MEAALHALNRFGLGARIGEARTIADARGWLNAQLDGGAPLLRRDDLPDADALGGTLRGLRAAVAANDRTEARRRVQQTARLEMSAALEARITSDRPFVERLVAFWSNHLCVSAAGKLPVLILAGSYERDVIRPHVLGRFEDMVLASARHPAMLLYLDNGRSIGPDSPAARLVARRGAERGLNENYARELLELHTLGVDGGYTQEDVQQLARILTGWTVSGVGGRDQAGGRGRRPGAGRLPRADGPVRFFFADALHEPGTKTLMGERYGVGEGEGERAIRALCRHRSTARFVATKLVRHFVADDPPAVAVDRVATVFHETGGDLRAVAAALIDLPGALSDEHRKFRTPQEWLIAILRAVNVRTVDERAVLALNQLRHPLWAPGSPAGFGDRMGDWADPDALLNRAELARTITRQTRERVDPRALLDVVRTDSADPLRSLLADTTIPAADRVALALAGPAFQWR